MPAKKTTDVVSTEPSTEPTLAWGTTAFEPGSDIGLVARYTVGLVERDNPSTRERLWRLVSEDARLDDILDELSSTGLKALPDFGLAQIEGSAVRIVARGRTTISAELSSGPTHEIDPSGVRTWIEELVEDVASITITLSALDGDGAPADDETFAVLAGSVPARSLTRRYDAADDHAEAAESDAGWSAGDVDASASGGNAEELGVASDAEAEMATDTDASETESADGISWSDEQAAGPVPADAQPASPQPPPPDFAPSAPSSPDPDSGDPLPSTEPLDTTVVVGPNDGPTRGPASSIFDDFEDHAAGSSTGVLPDDDEVADTRSETDDRQSDADHDADLDADHDAERSGEASDHGVLAFSNGQRIDVDRTILIGRNPKVAGAVEGGLPHIMKFDGPGQGLSRTHAEVRVEGGVVLIEDLQSTNGTEVQLPGQPRRRLRSGEPFAIVPGTLIDFGDELHCTLESAG